jgi:hypothetical protein
MEDSLTFGPAKTFKDTIERRSYLNDLARAVQQLGRLIAIGAPDKVITDAFSKQDLLYFQSDESCWPHMFDLAATAARTIILIPGTSPGLLREVRTLRSSGSLSKTILFMPPTPRGAIRWIGEYNQPREVAREWEHARNALTNIGIKLPEYKRRPAWFSPLSGREGRVDA